MKNAAYVFACTDQRGRVVIYYLSFFLKVLIFMKKHGKITP